MQSIKRDIYLQEIIDRKENGLIKIIIGVRRCDNSYLLFNLYYGYLLAMGVDENNIIALDLDDDRNRPYRDPDKLRFGREWRTPIEYCKLHLIIVKDDIKLRRNEKGLLIMSIFDFLLTPDSLELF